MLQFVLGRAASGKSTEILNRIRLCAERGESTVLIVPEQFSFESERAVLAAVGDRMAQKISVLSFTRLCDEVERISGGLSGRTMTDSDHIILMTRAVSGAGEALGPFNKYASSAGFVSQLTRVIGEFKANAVSPEDLFSAADRISGAFAEKLRAIAAVYSSFSSLTAERFIDPAARLNRIYDRLQICRYFEGKQVFIDSFKGFTGSQLKIFERIFAQSENVTVSLCYDKSSKTGIFSNIEKLYNRISRIAASYNVKISKDIELCDNHYENGGVAALERLLALGVGSDTPIPEITVCNAETAFDEVEYVTRTIRRLVRTEGVAFEDFVIIARNTEGYEQILDSACKRGGINCFIDRRLPFLSTPAAVCVSSAIKAAMNMTAENIFAFHKSGFELLSVDELSQLENYTYLWNIDGKDFQRQWDMNPAGLTDREIDLGELETLNSLRSRAIEPILQFKNEFYGNAERRAAAVYNMLVRLDAAKTFKSAEEGYIKDGKPDLAEALRSSWGELMTLLDSLSLCFGETDITSREFYDVFSRAAALVTVGVIPQTLDEVTFGAADRIRPSRPKYVFILGAVQGVFPAGLPNGGLLSVGERAILADLDIEISDCSISSAVDEDYLVYSSLTCASRGVFITCPTELDGSSVTPSAFVKLITDKLKPNFVSEPQPISKANLPETAEAAFGELCRRAQSGQESVPSLIEALSKTELNARMQAAVFDDAAERFKLSRAAAGALFGKSLRMSPSRFDDFCRCRFMYFCRDGLSVRPLQPAAFDVMQRGTLVHYVLQRVIDAYGKEIARLKGDEIPEIVDRFTEEYLDKIVGYRSVENTYLRYLVGSMKHSLCYVVSRLAEEFAQSEFEPISCELKIGNAGDIPEIKVPLEDGAELCLNGVVDRLDKWNGYVRIVDYKTGSRKFRLPDILFGQNMQMLIYLYAVSRDSSFGGKPAGILYMPASHSIAAQKSERRMNGLLNSNSDVLAAMESERNGRFIPKFEKRSANSFVEEGDFEKIFKFIEGRLARVGNQILSGDVAPSPIDGIDSEACKYCDFSAICRIKDEEHERVPKMDNSEVLSLIEEEVGTDGI